MKMKTIVSYGAGTNSTAMLVGLFERGERPDAILFADTGGERPSTYEHVLKVNEWCLMVGFPEIITLRATGKTLEQDCLDRKALPSIAYGFKTCSQRWKKQPQDKWMNNNDGFKDAIKLLGIDAGEPHRVKDFPNTRYPLVEWDWDRDECVEAIKRAALPQPGKSACFFCPSSKPKEILLLRQESPDLLERALAMEQNAELTSIKGLGRNYSWTELINYQDSQIDMFRTLQETPCECFDG
jgi:hypothetical protein